LIRYDDMKKYIFKPPFSYIVVFIVVATIMTTYEAIKETIFDGRLSQWESHMITIVVTSFLATLAAIIMQSWTKSLAYKEQELIEKEASVAAQKLILGAVNHILNNFLNHFLIIRINLEKNTPIEKNTLDMLDQSVADVSEKLRVLELLYKPEKKASYTNIYPS